PKLVLCDPPLCASGKSVPEVVAAATATTLRNSGWIDIATPPSSAAAPVWTNGCVAPGAPPPPVLFPEATASPTPQSTAGLTSQPSPVQIPEATPSPTPQPSPVPTPAPTVVPEP